MRMVFKELFLFSPREKRARRIAFERGLNIVTSSKVDGTKRGKSVVMRSLFHSLGAETFLESRFETQNKVFILHFEVDSVGYYIYRTDDLFKVFDESRQLLFTSTRSRDLAEKLSRITRFCVQLPSRSHEKLEITPPAYNYLPFFIDQDHYNGSNFESFDNLGQYSNFKEKVLLYHFGIHTAEYFDLVRTKEQIEETKNKLENRIKVLSEILKDIDGKLNGCGYSKDLEALKRDVGQYQKKYSEVVRNLNQSRAHLIAFRNALYDYETAVMEISKFERKNESAIRCLHVHKCPECGSELDMPVSLKSRRYNLAEDILGVKSDIQTSMIELRDKIEKEEHHYRGLLEVLHKYELSMKIGTAEIDDVLRFKGLCEVRESMAEEFRIVQSELEKSAIELSDLLKRIKVFNDRKKIIADRYYEMLVQAKARIGLDEIDSESFKKLSNHFGASGSNKCIATIAWHFAIIQLRNEFNSEAIQFPIVFDSPNNVETDDEKTDILIKYLFDNSGLSAQFIFSGIGFDSDEFRTKTDKPTNIIVLSNEQYHLLLEEDYIEYHELLDTFCNAGLLPEKE